ncbi:helix-turn-helix domain-containing protein [Empedobacter sedimenti]|uniref:helix-turn-helix domain-containing protein n=1 Tax=Empedobacter sedimenti TaxID=3042610 RepID=UPI0024A65FCC|nr:helix-turn-helix transcriptional regulator [Empedobacter sedimenti]
MNIGTIIKDARIKKGISQKSLATLIGCDVSFICKVEKNEKNISLEKLKALSSHIEIDLFKLKIEYYSHKINSLFENEDIEFKNRVLKMMIE